MKYSTLIVVAALLVSSACNKKNQADASGYFEADEVIVSAQQNGELLSFGINEGDKLSEGAIVGQIDVTLPLLQQQQVQASIEALQDKTKSAYDQNELVKRQLAVQEAQLSQMLQEKTRTENLVKADAATRKQLDDINAQVDQLQKQVAVTRQQIRLNTSNTETQNKSILSEKMPLSKAAQQYEEQVRRGQVVNPVAGTVLAKYALKGEMAMIGKPLYKIADTDTLTLKAYITGDKLLQVRTGQQVQVRVDQGKKDYKTYPGVITWISSRSEFTPKTIQTKNERANLVYALKVKVKNDGFLKIGMYGEVLAGTGK